MKPDKAKIQAPSNSRPADYSLLIERTEKALLHGADPDSFVGMLGDKNTWKQLTEKQLLRWADLCQMAGAMDAALGVYEFLHAGAPETEVYWERHLELLLMLNRRDAAVRVLAAARTHMAESWLRQWQTRLQQILPAAGEKQGQNFSFIQPQKVSHFRESTGTNP